MGQDKLFDILMKDNVIESIYNDLGVLLEMIPEIHDLIGFPHNHPHHHLDIWHHTLLALSFAPMEFDVRLVLLLHDIGKPISYQDEEVRHFYGHAQVSADMANKILKRLNFERGTRKEICYLIKQHDTPITIRKIKKEEEMCKKKYKIQFCDALAHNPDFLDKRIEYLIEINKELNILQNLIQLDEEIDDKKYDFSGIKKLVLTKNKNLK